MIPLGGTVDLSTSVVYPHFVLKAESVFSFVFFNSLQHAFPHTFTVIEHFEYYTQLASFT